MCNTAGAGCSKNSLYLFSLALSLKSSMAFLKSVTLNRPLSLSSNSSLLEENTRRHIDINQGQHKVRLTTTSWCTYCFLLSTPLYSNTFLKLPSGITVE